MKVQAPFGLVTGCHKGDKFIVGATLASMRHYCPDVPICLVVDGDFDVSDLESQYDLIVLRVSDLPSQEMREMIGGNYRAKLAALWEGPFEFYVWMDSDAIVWGDFTKQVRTDVDFHIFWSEISIPPDATEVPHWVSHFYFDLEKLKKFDPDFEWRGHPYFCTGAFGCRRDAITFQQWAEIEQWQKQVPDLFQWGEMGMLNYLVLSASQRGEMSTDWIDLQWTRNFGFDELLRNNPVTGWDFSSDVKHPAILHFCGRKPNIFDFKCYSRPFTTARLAHHRRRHSYLGAWWTIVKEDGEILSNKIIGRLKRILRAG